MTNDAKILEVEDVNLFIKENAVNHHTSEYEVIELEKGSELVIRRGQPFNLEIKTKNRAYNKEMDKIDLIFKYDFGDFKDQPNVVELMDKTSFTRESQHWDVIAESSKDKSLNLKVRSPFNGKIGSWTLVVNTSLKKSKGGHKKFAVKPNIFMLFNPWNKDDQCFLQDTSSIEEYVLSPHGKIYFRKNYKDFYGRDWNYSQFYYKIFAAIKLMLKGSRLKTKDMGNAIKISRTISERVNSNDGGVLIGNWSSDFSGGTAPHAWVGSKRIIDEFVDSGGRSVKWAQCYVYSPFVVTVCRALGIPCRNVTNLASGHDTNASLTIDVVYDKNNKHMQTDRFGSDSVWNFHVWNEVWMTRRDLLHGYDGWQVIDATPQERSEGLMQVGPFPVTAVKEGKVGVNYDGEFVFAEVNADVLFWKQDDKSPTGFRKSSMSYDQIGLLLITKKANSTDHEIITNLYKYDEGSKKERRAVMNAVRQVEKAVEYYDFPSNYVETKCISLAMDNIEDTNFGEDFQIKFSVNNDSNEKRTVKCQVSVSSIFYTGKLHRPIKNKEIVLKLTPNHSTFATVLISASEYLNKLVNFANLEISIVAQDEKTEQCVFETKKITLLVPKLKVEVFPREDSVNETRKVRCSFVNPAAICLTGVQFCFEGYGFHESGLININKSIKPKEKFEYEVSLVPKKKTTCTVMASVSSKQVTSVVGSCTFNVSG